MEDIGSSVRRLLPSVPTKAVAASRYTQVHYDYDDPFEALHIYVW